MSGNSYEPTEEEKKLYEKMKRLEKERNDARGERDGLRAQLNEKSDELDRTKMALTRKERQYKKLKSEKEESMLEDKLNKADATIANQNTLLNQKRNEIERLRDELSSIKCSQKPLHIRLVLVGLSVFWDLLAMILFACCPVERVTAAVALLIVFLILENVSIILMEIPRLLNTIFKHGTIFYIVKSALSVVTLILIIFVFGARI